MVYGAPRINVKQLSPAHRSVNYYRTSIFPFSVRDGRVRQSVMPFGLNNYFMIGRSSDLVPKKDVRRSFLSSLTASCYDLYYRPVFGFCTIANCLFSLSLLCMRTNPAPAYHIYISCPSEVSRPYEGYI